MTRESTSTFPSTRSPGTRPGPSRGLATPQPDAAWDQSATVFLGEKATVFSVPGGLRWRVAVCHFDATFQMGRLSDFPSRADLGPDLVAKGFVSREAVEEVFEFLFGQLRNLAGGRG